ncbi:MAG: leucine-rich repeat protein [Bacteroidales bacterium]|nr:leucine-rich repeat protein [Bacteroidales bacterium]
MDDSFITPEVDTSLPVQLYNEIVQVPTTRVNDEGFCDGDAVGIYVVNFEDGVSGTLKTEDNQADNVKYVYDEVNFVWVPEEEVYFRDRNTHVDIYGYYPYANPASIGAYPFEVQKDQSTAATNGALGGYEASDFLWGKAADITPTASRINLKFNHRMAGVQITLVEGTGWDEGEWAQIEKSALVTNTKRKATIDLATGVVTATGDVPTTGTVPYLSGDDFRAIVVPQTLSAGMAMFSLTVDGIPYTFRYRVDGATADFEYLSGKLHKFSIEVSKKSQSGLEFKLLGNSITAWETDNTSHDASAREYIIIDVPEARLESYENRGSETDCGLAIAINEAGYDYAEIKHLKITGKINSIDFMFIRKYMRKLQSINLKDVSITHSAITSSAGYFASGDPNQIPEDALNGMKTLVRVIFPDNITKILSRALQGTNVTGILDIPNGVTEIGESAFYSLNFTGTLTLPHSLEIIGDAAFAYCKGFSSSLVLPNKLRIIGDRAFECCSGLTGELILPNSLELLGDNLGSSFRGCSGFSGSLTIPDGIVSVCKSSFYGCIGLDGGLILPKGIVSIETEAFSGCSFRGILNIPKSVIVIGDNAFYNNKFSGELKLPSELASLGSAAFAGCSRLTGVVEIPNDIISVPGSVFSGCTKLEGVILPRTLENIGAYAFQNCYQLNSITCKATTPPTVASTAFNGVAKDNFTVEVPEAAVMEYSTAPVWKEFKRFAAHRDFSISRNLFRTLNASDSKTLVLRAEADAAWTVEAPEWITVTPSSGVGKTEVTVSVNEMTASDVATFDVTSYTSTGSTTTTSYAGRSGKVVFHLTGKDYSSTTTVEQYNYEHYDGKVITNQTASEGNGVNIVFMGDCFDAQDIATGKYLAGVNEAIEHFFAVEPYKSYKKYFNIYTVFGLSADSGVGSVNTIREAKFGSQYGLQAAGSVGVNENICFEYACKAPTVTEDNISQTAIVLVENTYDYDGITYMWGDGSAIALCPMSNDEYPYDFRGIVQHEAGGHAFGKLGDEYIYHNTFIQNCPVPGCDSHDQFLKMKSYGFYDNLSLSGDMNKVPWSHMIFDPQFSGTVDIYEGGFFHTRGVFRSESNSCMNNNVPYFSAISRETIVKRIMKSAGLEYSYEAFKANDISLAIEEVAAMAPTRSTGARIPYVVKGQSVPIFMGERPNFKKYSK